MIFGDCPYTDCDDCHMIECADVVGWSRETCDGCGREWWLHHSRVNPEALTPEEFAREWVIDEATHTISPKTHEHHEHDDKVKWKKEGF